MTLSRRRFLAVVGAVAGASALPEAVVARALAQTPDAARAAADLTTLAQTIVAGSATPLGYRSLATGPGELHVVRTELAGADPGRAGRRASLLAFIHLTDQHITDVQSPARVEFLDRYNDGDQCSSLLFSSAWRPQEAACARVADAMIRRLRRIGVSPVTGAPLTAAVCTGDNTDNQQANELALFLAVMDGGRATPQSGDPARYEGVQASGDLSYWHPDPAVQDRYKTVFGFPSRAGFLDAALAQFDAIGLGVPWYSAYGNHDGLIQGNFPENTPMERIALGPVKPTGLPPGANPCTPGSGLGVPGAPGSPVTADPGRAIISRTEWVAGHLASPGLPRGHGFTSANVEGNTAYYAADVGPLRWLVLDTVNPGGESSGSIGDGQLTWLQAELERAMSERRLVLLFSHHGLRSLDSSFSNPEPAGRESDLPRRHADEVEPLVQRYPCVIGWINGHSHANVVVPRRTFWDIGTAAHVDWPPQSRLVEVVDNRDGTLSIFATMVDHDDDEIASFARELTANDPQAGIDSGAAGEPTDRNVELVIAHPFPASGPGAADPDVGAAPPAVAPIAAPIELPATGTPLNLTLGGALALALAGALGRRRAP